MLITADRAEQIGVGIICARGAVVRSGSMVSVEASFGEDISIWFTAMFGDVVGRSNSVLEWGLEILRWKNG